MAGNRLASVLRHLRRIAEPGHVSDAELLDRFAGGRDETAFGLLVSRHGPMVLALCQRVLRHEHDSEDVFQATFLTLARKAKSIGKKEALAGWLYKVAYRIACRARGAAPIATNQSAAMAAVPAPEVEASVIWRELRPVLDQEIARLSEAQRRVIVLCYLEGKTQEETSQLLGCPKGTVAARFARARQRLCQRLTRRGLAPSAAVLATVLADNAVAQTIPAELVHGTVQAALAYLSGKAALAGILSAKAVVLTEGALQMMWYSKMKMFAVAFLVLTLSGSGVGLAMREIWAGGEQDDPLATRVVQDAGPAQAAGGGASKADVKALRDEIAKLRLELKSALNESKSLKDPSREPLQVVEVKARVSGYLTKILFKEGDDVAEGAILFHIDDRPYKAALDQAKASLDMAVAHLAKTDVDVNSAAAIAKKGNISPAPLMSYQAVRDEAQAKVAHAKAVVQSADLNYGWCKVKAPIAGRAGAHFVITGNLVIQDVTILTKITPSKSTSALDPEPTYQGKPARFWLNQLKDADSKYRREAAEALGALAPKNKDLIPVLVESLKDERVADAGARALGHLGPDVVPPLLEILKDKTSVGAQINAAVALGGIGPKAKAAVPMLAEALKENNWTLRWRVIYTLGKIGPEAKSAIPAMMDVLEASLKKLDDEGKELGDKGLKKYGSRGREISGRSTDSPIVVFGALWRIDPTSRNLLPKNMEPSGDRWPSATLEDLHQAFEALRKRYANGKQ